MEITRQRKTIITVVVIVFILTWLAYQFPDFIHDYRADRFVKEWVNIFAGCQTIVCASAASGTPPERFYKRTFENGEWVIALNTDACRNDGGLDACVFYGSDRIFHYQVGYAICGQQLFIKTLNNIAARELTEFYDRLPFEVRMKMR